MSKQLLAAKLLGINAEIVKVTFLNVEVPKALAAEFEDIMPSYSCREYESILDGSCMEITPDRLYDALEDAEFIGDEVAKFLKCVQTVTADVKFDSYNFYLREE